MTHSYDCDQEYIIETIASVRRNRVSTTEVEYKNDGEDLEVSKNEAESKLKSFAELEMKLFKNMAIRIMQSEKNEVNVVLKQCTRHQHHRYPERVVCDRCSRRVNWKDRFYRECCPSQHREP
jgi:hypothetical protein